MEFDWIGIKEPLLQWYRRSHRDLAWRNTKNPYHIWISEIMLQQTRVEAVKEYYDRFLKRLPDIQALSSISEDALLKLWEGLGYYNRARNLQRAAVRIMEDYDGVFPVEYESVRSLPGIGDYTAGAVCSICYELPTPAVDGNVLRVMMRLSECYDNIDSVKTKKAAGKALMPLYETGNCGELTQALMELGAVICIPNGIPKCTECPLNKQCLAYKRQTYDKLPVRNKKKERKIEEKTVFILHEGTSYAIQKRKEKGLLANMWEFYNIEGKLGAQDAVRHISGQGLEPVLVEKEIPYTHVFSHVEWRMTAYYIECRKKAERFTWIEREEFERTYALPTAFRVFIEEES